MEFAIPLRPDSLIRAPEPGVDRDVLVDLDGSFSTMKESQLVRTAGGHDNDNEVAAWVEYRLGDKLVHRSAHVHLKKSPFYGEAIAASLG